MARGRMLNKSVSLSMKYHDLPDDTCRLLATWTISHLDCNGVFYADPAIVKSLVFPMRVDLSIQKVAEYLDAMVAAGLITLFKSDGRLWQCWPGFDHNQTGLRKDRENTDYPPPQESAEVIHIMPEVIRKDSGNLPENIPPNLNLNLNQKVKVKVNARADKQPAPFMDDPLVAIYRDITHITPNESARQMLAECGLMPEPFKASVREWIAHGWNPKNIPDMIARCRNPQTNGNGNGKVYAGGSAGDQAIRMIMEEHDATK